MLAPGSFASVQAADLPAGVDQQRAEPALVSFVVSFSYVRTRSACPTEDGQPRSRTVATYAVPSRADLESVWGTLAARPDQSSAERVVVWAQFWSHSLLFTPVHQRPRTARPGW